MSTKREQAISDRRRRIFDAARSIIATGGLDSLTTRALAQGAKLTVPTLYNLVGGKDEILTQMLSHDVEAIWARLDFDRRADPLDMADAIIAEAYEVVRADKALHRACLPLMIDLQVVFAANPGRDDPGARAANRCVEMAQFACETAIKRGDLRGTIPAAELGQQMFITYRGPMRDWLEGVITDEEMLRRQRRGFYLVMAADASDAFRADLLDRIAQLEPATPLEDAA
ncbi:MAG: TetR/AcrR family transcriptional regulator [Pseudomonadota bacterium]